MVLNILAGYIEDIYNYYLWTLTLADSRTKGWLFISSPLPTLFLTFLYLVIVWIGPKIMKNRNALKLTGPLILYNLGITLVNLYIFVRLFTASLRLQYNYICEPYRDSNDPDELQITDAIWWFYFSKVLEFSDTFFFILRKKEEQLSFLHVYHHSTMFPLWWIGAKWVPGGSAFLPALINSGIHVLMYSYYGLSALGPQVTKYLWWKKYLTILQLIQFTTGLVLGINAIRIGCEFPLWMHWTVILYMISFVILFGNFYVKAYMEKRKQVLYGVDMGCGQGVLFHDNEKRKMKEDSLQNEKHKTIVHSRDKSITSKKSE